ncbi:Glycosyltransferase family 25 (LPS biosynthesis protein) [Raoultella ornithinolytica]|nr:Glycosyltransferase family 25 (LPS biosynthesis protein) [Raoultella ornithinolytica]
MIPVFIISMKNDLGRRQRITEQLNKYNIPFTFIDAVVGKMLDKTSIEQIDLSKVINRKKGIYLLGRLVVHSVM